MAGLDLLDRVKGLYIRGNARLFFRRPRLIDLPVPIISFSFDDFPRSALLTGGAILERSGLHGTYYASFDLMGKKAPSGDMFLPEDLKALLIRGHELGCHTFAHCNSWETETRVFEKSIIDNQLALGRLFPKLSLQTFSYPISPPRAQIKHKAAKHFVCCRGGGQTFNVGTADLNYLSAYFLEQNRDNPQAVKDLIEENKRARGWLIFATHDVSDDPSPFGCRPEFFADIVQYAVRSGARILPIVQAVAALDSFKAPGRSLT